jgi:hypothetical protein
MTPEAEKAYVDRWVETGRLLEDLRWRELSVLDDTAAFHATDRLIEAALLVPIPLARRQWSGLVEWHNRVRLRSDR